MVIAKKDNQEQGEAKLEDILKSIRGIIDDHSNTFSSDDSSNITSEVEEDRVLELTNVFVPEIANDAGSLISENIKRKTEAEIARFTTKINETSIKDSSTTLDFMVNQLMRPLVKEWLNNNLPRIVEKVVTEEIKRIVPKP